MKDERKEELYQTIRKARQTRDYYYELADRTRTKERADKYIIKAEKAEAEEQALIKALEIIYDESTDDVDKFIHDYELSILDDEIARCRSYIIGSRFHSSKVDIPMAILAYENMVFYATDRELDTKEYQICKHNFEITFRKELSKRGKNE